MRFRLIPILGIFIILIFSCQVPDGFEESSEESENVQIKSIEPGKFVEKDETIPVSIEFEEIDALLQRIEIDLLSQKGTILGSQVYAFENPGDPEEVPGISLPEEMEEGLYTLVYRLYDLDEELVKEEKVPFFYVTGEYDIKSVRSYPTTVEPASQMLFIAEVLVPAGRNPYMRWKLDDTVLMEGYVSEGAASFTWVAPEIEGIYSITAELYPVYPEAEVLFSSQTAISTEVYVTKEPKIERGEFQPEEQFYSLFHFRGNAVDSGTRTEDAEAVPFGTPELRVDGDLFGYYLDGASGFTVDGLIIPAEDGRLLPFSLLMLSKPDEQRGEATVFSAGASAGGEEIALTADETGTYRLVFRRGEEVSLTSAPPRPLAEYISPGSGEGLKLIVSVVPELIEGRERFTFLWYVNENLVFVDRGYTNFPVDSGEWESTIGGEQGFAGLVDEFGIYFNEEEEVHIIREVYRREMYERYGNDLRLAEGFDSAELPDEFQVDGEAHLESGNLILDPGAELIFPPLKARLEELQILFECAGEPAGEGNIFIIEDADEESFRAELDAGGAVRVNGEEKKTEPLYDEENIIRFLLTHEQNGGNLEAGGALFSLYTGENDGFEFTLRIRNESDAPFIFNALRIVSSSVQVVQTEESDGEVQETEEAVTDDAEPLVRTRRGASEDKDVL
jgi:hypothetical protein